MADGKTSFEDWPILTWSFGCTGFLLPRLSPSAHWRGWTGPRSCSCWTGCLNRSARRRGEFVVELALHDVRSSGRDGIGKAGIELGQILVHQGRGLLDDRQRVNERVGIRSPPMRKFWIERWVWAPQSLSAGTSMGPKVSVSVRVDGDILTSFQTLAVLISSLTRRNTQERDGGCKSR